MESDKLEAKVPWGGAGINPLPECETKMVGEMSFNDLMSETLAIEMQKQFDDDALPVLNEGGLLDEATFLDSSTNDDMLIAQMLQYEFDREYDQQIDREEKHVNKNCKMSISYDKYKLCPTWYGEDPEDAPHDMDNETRFLDAFEESEKQDLMLSARGYARSKNGIITKHDTAISGRNNAKKVMDLPLGFNTGDGGGFNMRIDNKVYNDLHECAKNESKRANRLKDKLEGATTTMALDQQTKKVVYNLTSNGTLQEITGNISTGKESVVFLGRGGPALEVADPTHAEVVLKVFKTRLTEFKNRGEYIKADYRFKNRVSKNSNKSIKIWAEKEYHNLVRLNDAGVPSPRVFLVKDHVLMMSFLGHDGVAAPKLKQLALDDATWLQVYAQVVENMKAMYHRCNLIHADLSEYNILYWENKCYFIDLGQSVEPVHPNAFKFLLRDCTNIINFFSSKRVPHLPTATQLFTQVSQIPLLKSNHIDAIRDLETDKFTESEGTHDEIFSYFWDKIVQQQASIQKNQEPPQEEEEDDEEEEVEEVGEETTRSPKTKRKSRRKHKKSKDQIQ